MFSFEWFDVEGARQQHVGSASEVMRALTPYLLTDQEIQDLSRFLERAMVSDRYDVAGRFHIARMA